MFAAFYYYEQNYLGYLSNVVALPSLYFSGVNA